MHKRILALLHGSELAEMAFVVEHAYQGKGIRGESLTCFTLCASIASGEKGHA